MKKENVKISQTAKLAQIDSIKQKYNEEFFYNVMKTKTKSKTETSQPYNENNYHLRIHKVPQEK